MSNCHCLFKNKMEPCVNVIVCLGRDGTAAGEPGEDDRADRYAQEEDEGHD